MFAIAQMIQQVAITTMLLRLLQTVDPQKQIQASIQHLARISDDILSLVNKYVHIFKV
jgi:uncharacterized protein YjiS (DUF1127 family)